MVYALGHRLLVHIHDNEMLYMLCCSIALVAINHETAWINHTKVSVIDQFIDNLKKHHTTVHVVSVQLYYSTT